jgi:hypothetical protein
MEETGFQMLYSSRKQAEKKTGKVIVQQDETSAGTTNINTQADLRSIKPGLSESCAFPGRDHPVRCCQQRDL